MHDDVSHGRWAVDDPEYGRIVGFKTAREARRYIVQISPDSVLVRLKAPRFHGPWSKLWRRRVQSGEWIIEEARVPPAVRAGLPARP